MVKLIPQSAQYMCKLTNIVKFADDGVDVLNNNCPYKM